ISLFSYTTRRPPIPTLFPYTTLFRSHKELVTPTGAAIVATLCEWFGPQPSMSVTDIGYGAGTADLEGQPNVVRLMIGEAAGKSEIGRHTSELQSPYDLVCRLLLEKKK